MKSLTALLVVVMMGTATAAQATSTRSFTLRDRTNGSAIPGVGTLAIAAAGTGSSLSTPALSPAPPASLVAAGLSKTTGSVKAAVRLNSNPLGASPTGKSFDVAEAMTAAHDGAAYSGADPARTITPVPEPGTMLLGAGSLCLAIYGKRRKNV